MNESIQKRIFQVDEPKTRPPNSREDLNSKNTLSRYKLTKNRIRLSSMSEWQHRSEHRWKNIVNLSLSLHVFLISIAILVSRNIIVADCLIKDKYNSYDAKPCKNSLGQIGTCMFLWDCIKSDGQHLGACSDKSPPGSSCCHHNTNSSNTQNEIAFTIRHPKSKAFTRRTSSLSVDHNEQLQNRILSTEFKRSATTTTTTQSPPIASSRQDQTSNEDNTIDVDKIMLTKQTQPTLSSIFQKQHLAFSMPITPKPHHFRNRQFRISAASHSAKPFPHQNQNLKRPPKPYRSPISTSRPFQQRPPFDRFNDGVKKRHSASDLISASESDLSSIILRANSTSTTGVNQTTLTDQKDDNSVHDSNPFPSISNFATMQRHRPHETKNHHNIDNISSQLDDKKHHYDIVDNSSLVRSGHSNQTSHRAHHHHRGSLNLSTISSKNYPTTQRPTTHGPNRVGPTLPSVVTSFYNYSIESNNASDSKYNNSPNDSTPLQEISLVTSAFAAKPGTVFGSTSSATTPASTSSSSVSYYLNTFPPNHNQVPNRTVESMEKMSGLLFSGDKKSPNSTQVNSASVTFADSQDNELGSNEPGLTYSDGAKIVTQVFKIGGQKASTITLVRRKPKTTPASIIRTSVTTDMPYVTGPSKIIIPEPQTMSSDASIKNDYLQSASPSLSSSSSLSSSQQQQQQQQLIRLISKQKLKYDDRIQSPTLTVVDSDALRLPQNATSVHNNKLIVAIRPGRPNRRYPSTTQFPVYNIVAGITPPYPNPSQIQFTRPPFNDPNSNWGLLTTPRPNGLETFATTPSSSTFGAPNIKFPALPPPQPPPYQGDSIGPPANEIHTIKSIEKLNITVPTSSSSSLVPEKIQMQSEEEHISRPEVPMDVMVTSNSTNVSRPHWANTTTNQDGIIRLSTTRKPHKFSTTKKINIVSANTTIVATNADQLHEVLSDYLSGTHQQSHHTSQKPPENPGFFASLGNLLNASVTTSAVAILTLIKTIFVAVLVMFLPPIALTAAIMQAINIG